MFDGYSFSAKDLLCRSCKQIKMFQEYPGLRPKPNRNVLNGETYQHQIACEYTDVIGEEMRGTYIDNVYAINFSNDIVCNDKIIEVKSVNDEPEEWYFHSSVLQCAFYKAMIMSGANNLETAMFYRELGHELKTATVNPDIEYILRFGDGEYDIYVKDSKRLIDFFLDKAKSCVYWSDARRFDEKYKHKEYEILKDTFEYEKITKNVC